MAEALGVIADLLLLAVLPAAVFGQEAGGARPDSRNALWKFAVLALL